MCLKLFPVFTAHVQHGIVIFTKDIYFDQSKISEPKCHQYCVYNILMNKIR